MGLTKIAITRPVFMLMLMMAAFLLGWMSYNQMRVEQNPEVNFGVLTINTVYPGAGPEEVNTLVSRKIEEAAAGVSGIREVTSASQEGTSTVVAQFELGTNMDVALNETRAKVDAILNQLPQGIEKPTISKFDTASEPVLYMVARGEKLSNQQLRDLIDDKLKDKFAQIPGVAGVNVIGGDVREIQVQLKKDSLLAYGLGVIQVQQAVQAATLNVPSGRVVEGGREYSVRVLGEFKHPKDLEKMMLEITDPQRPFSKGKIVRLSDIATVQDTVQERTSYGRLDQSDAVVVVVQKAREGSAIEISKAAHVVIGQIEKDYGVRFVPTRNQAKIIKESISDLNFALFFGIFLVALIVYLFLHNLRGTIIVAIAIPVCIFATFIAMRALGFTINNLSMLALSLAVGVLVDDCIVVLENIYRHLKMGEDPVTAAINGRGEIGLAAIAITLADVVVFLPIGFMGGVSGQFFKPLGIGFAITVLLSLFVSFTITPMLASRWYRKGEDVEHVRGGFAGWFEHRFKRLEDLYRRMLRWALAHRWFVFISGNAVLICVFMMIGGSFAPNAGAAIATGMGPLFVSVIIGALVFVGNIFRGYVKPRLILSGLFFGLAFPISALVGFGWAQWKGEALFKFAFFPPNDSGAVAVDIQLPPGASLEATQSVVNQIEALASKHPDAKYVLSQVGSLGGGGFAGTTQGSQYANVTVTLNDKKALMDSLFFWVPKKEKLRTRPDTAVAADLTEQIGRVAGAQIKVRAGDQFGFGAAIQLSFRGDNREQVMDTVLKIRERLSQGAIEGLINIDISSKPGKPELRAIPDRVKLADFGITVAEIAAAMRILYEGNKDTKLRINGKEYNIRVMMDLVDRNNPNIVGSVPVAFVQGNPVYLSEVARIEPGVGVDKIDRRDRQEEVRLTADLLPGFAAGSVQAQIDALLAKENLVAEGVRFRALGQADVQGREMIFLMTALFLGVILVYMLLASLYDNLLYPLIIQLAQPQAMVGALLALMLTDKTFNIVGFIGIIALVGLVGKNAILLVDYANTLRSRGHSRLDALIEAGPTRLRPIMMTTLAVILGMLPVAMAIGRGSEFRETIGIIIIGGITLSTLLTLLVIPCSYTIFDDLSVSLGRVIRRFSGRFGGKQETPSPSETSSLHLDGHGDPVPSDLPEPAKKD